MKGYDLNLPKWKWPFHPLTHPIEGFEDMRWKKAYSMTNALIIVALFFIIAVVTETSTPFLFRTFTTRVFNVVPVFSTTVLMFFTWVVANWSLCTLFDGEGTMKRICVTSAYALIPYLISEVIIFLLSFVLSRQESGFIQFVAIIGFTWSVVLLISGMKAVHQYSMLKTIGSILATLFAMMIIVFLLVLLATLFQQVYIFVYSIYTELMYRFPTLEPWQLITMCVSAVVVVVGLIIAGYNLMDKIKAKREEKALRAG